MMKSLKLYFLGLITSSALISQDLCPPAFVDALFYSEKIELSWVQSSSYGDVLFDECFSSCSLAVEAMQVVHVDTSCGACSGGWFRYSDGTEADCGEGMYPCEDGGNDDFSAYAGYSGTDSTTDMYAPVDSRMITDALDLTGYTAAYVEFIEAYNYPQDATDSNMVEVSIDSGATWEMVYASKPWDVDEDIWFNTIDISSYAGNVVWVAFRYYDSVGYGESWFVDDIRVWGGNEGDGDICGTFNHFNVYMDGALIGTADSSGLYTAEDLVNDTEYCFEITSVYDEGESVPSATVCAVPQGPFQVNPQTLNFDELMEGDYFEQIVTIQNFDTLDADFAISSVELSNIDAALDLVLSTFEDGTLGDFTNIPDLGEEWTVGDSATHSSTYLPFPAPPDGSQNFALYNDDAAGDDPFNPATPMLVSNPAFSGSDPSFLVFDLYFPNPAGPCEEAATYADDFKVKVSIDDGETWMLVDSTMETGVWYWASYMYNLEPYVSEVNSFRVAFQYTDCGGEWGYGVAIDNMAIKMGDSFTWLTVSPYRGNVSALNSYNDSIAVKVGAFGVYDGFSIEDELLVESGENNISILIGVGVEVSVDDPQITPIEFALHQNYPNPFNPETNIQFDVAEKSDVTISIFNIVGQKVATLVDGTPLGAATDLDGNYFILQVPPETYSVRFTMIGYQTLVMNDVRVSMDLTTTIDGALNESVVGLEEVVVQAERSMIQTDVTYSQANISSEEVEMLPVEEFEDVLSLQAGVVVTGGEIHVRGGRGGEISYMVDGITVTDPYNSGIAVEIENNAIQELQFISGTFNAEYGQAMSGIVNIVTKDGDYSDYSGNISSSMGDYYISKDLLFPQVDNANWNNISDLKANIEGPILPGRISFFVSGRQKRNDGYLYGERIFYPNSYLWSDTQNMFRIDSSVGLGNNYIPIDSLWLPAYYQDSLRSLIDTLRDQNAFDWVSMNWSKQTTYQAKVSWRVTPRIKLAYNRMYSETKSQGYSHAYRWNPDGRPYSFNTRAGDIVRMDISLNQSTFANIMYSNAVNHYRTHLSGKEDFYEIFDTLTFNDWGFSNGTLEEDLYNTDPRIFDYATGNNYEVGGKYTDIYNRKSNVKTYKAELTSQYNAAHQLKVGTEYRTTHITYNNLTVLQSAWTDYDAVILEPEDNTIHDSFQSMKNPFTAKPLDGRNPIEFSTYVQDKIESDDMVVNIGARYDYFDSQFWVLNDPEDPNYMSPVIPINRWKDTDGDGQISEEEMSFDNVKPESERLESNANGDPWYRKADPKTQVSPRFALAFPITDKGYLHFSYGHFFQNPSFSYIYDNPEFEVPAASGVSSTMGNADMEPQRTTQYEVGFSQQFGRDIGLEITGYFKDIRNLNSTEIKNSFIAGDRYGMYVNKDHANSKGITVALSKRSLQNFSGNLDYTYSVSEGNASDPTAAFYDEQSDIEPEKMLVPLDWDQRHTLNGTMTYHPTAISGISLVFNYGSGFPYTTTNPDGQRTSFENNGRKPATFNMDMRSFYNFTLTKSIQISAHINVYNLFDIRNEQTVYGDTGRSSYSLTPTYTPQYSGPMLNTLDEFLIVPSYYSAPRQIKLGISFSFQ